jgi:hypothetical protein
MLNRIPSVEVSDTTEADSSTTARKKTNLQNMKLLKNNRKETEQ